MKRGNSMSEHQLSIEKIEKAQSTMEEQQVLVQSLVDMSEQIDTNAAHMVNHVGNITQLSVKADPITTEGEVWITEVMELIRSRSESNLKRMETLETFLN